MDDQLESHPSMPLLPRVDRLDCLMKYISGKTSLWRSYKFSFGKKKKECMPIDAAIEGAAQSKETLLDRIESLEARLVQLSLEIESRKSSTSTSASTSSGGRDSIPSYPTFNNHNPRRGRPQQMSQLHQINISESQSDSERLQQEQKKKEEVSLGKQKFGYTNKRDAKKCKMGKKGNPPSWPHLKMLGC